MTAILFFYISLIFLIVIFALKYFGISFEHHEVISNIVCKNDEHCHRVVSKSKKLISKVKFRNFHILMMAIANFTKRKIIYLKRKFDSKQHPFFLSPQKPSHINKHSTSFFLKKVSEYKDSLRNKDLS